MRRSASVTAVVMTVFCCVAGAAQAAATPGWECVPTTAGQPVVSGGTGGAPSCGAGTTAVLAPTYVSSGVGGKPTAVFSAVNVQVVSGSGSTSGTVNGEGNLIVGYAENTSGHSQTGSNNLIVGSENGWKSYGGIVGGFKSQATGKYASTVGYDNIASAEFSFAAGEVNKASGAGASALGGEHNVAQGNESSVLGGDWNLASDPFASVVSGCENLAGAGSPLNASCSTSGAEGVLGGFGNIASGLEATVSGGSVNNATVGSASVAGGKFNSAGASAAAVAGGEFNIASGINSSILGGDGNSTSTSCQAIPVAPGTC